MKFSDTLGCTVCYQSKLYTTVIKGNTISFKTQFQFNGGVHTSQIHAEFEIVNTRWGQLLLLALCVQRQLM